MKKVRFLIGVKIINILEGSRSILVPPFEGMFSEHAHTSTIMKEIDDYTKEYMNENYFRANWEYLFISQVIL